MSLCVQCGQSTFGGESLCAYHSASYGEEWARGNRIMCDFLHRGIVPQGVRRRDTEAFSTRPWPSPPENDEVTSPHRRFASPLSS